MKSTNKKVKKTDNSDKLQLQEKKIERLELLAQAQELENVSIKVQALQVKLQQLKTEATMLNRDLNSFQEEAKKLFEVYSADLAAYKKKYNIPEGKEVNLKTGELVDAPSPPPQQQQVEVEQRSSSEAPQQV